MSSGRDDRLQRLLGGTHLADLRKRLRRRFETATPEEAAKRFRIGRLTSEEHAALAAFTGGRPRFSGSLQVDPSELDEALRDAGIAASLRAALEQLDGPIIHLDTERSRLRTLWSNVVNRCGHPALTVFLGVPAALGMLKRLSGGDPVVAGNLCRQAEAVLRSLPANGVTRARLAADILGDAHALDNGRAVATLVLAVWRRSTDAPGHGPEDGADRDGDALRDEKSREIWSRAGVLVNELARPAMFLNLPGSGHHGAPGEPGYISLRALLRAPPVWQVAGRAVYVCENPNLLAIAADHLGEKCAPMVCTEGMPAAAHDRLLTQLMQGDARLRYHGDFDWPGLRIGNYVMRAFGAAPWRYGAADYVAAVDAAPRPGHRLRGADAQASWDHELTTVMKDHQLAIAEEGLAETLLRDLNEAAAV